jgi:hypothetical protein
MSQTPGTSIEPTSSGMRPRSAAHVERQVSLLRTLTLALLIFAAPGPLLGQEGPRATRPAFKGVELYSWKDCTPCEWQFALLPGTNRLKTGSEIKNPARVIRGVPGLRQHLSRLAEGETVFWLKRPLPELSFPDPDTVDEVVRSSGHRKITVVVEG